MEGQESKSTFSKPDFYDHLKEENELIAEIKNIHNKIVILPTESSMVSNHQHYLIKRLATDQDM